jgi:hypothetical protein
VIGVNNLYIRAHQDVISKTYQIFSSDHAMTAYHRVIANVNLWIRLRELEKCIILNGAAIAHLKNGTIGQPEFGVVLDHYSTSRPGQVSRLIG